MSKYFSRKCENFQAREKFRAREFDGAKNLITNETYFGSPFV
jgi:hypothetical protein